MPQVLDIPQPGKCINRQNFKRKKIEIEKIFNFLPLLHFFHIAARTGPSRAKNAAGQGTQQDRAAWGPVTHWCQHHDPLLPVTSQGSSNNIFNCCYQEVKSFQVKNPAANPGAAGSTPGSGRSPGERNDSLLQYSCLGSPMDKVAWWVAAHRVAKSETLIDWLNIHARAELWS